MNSEIQMHDIVALFEDVPATHFTTSEPLTLRRGQIDAVMMMTYDGPAFEVKFSDARGPACVLLPIPASKLLLHDAPIAVAV